MEHINSEQFEKINIENQQVPNKINQEEKMEIEEEQIEKKLEAILMPKDLDSFNYHIGNYVKFLVTTNPAEQETLKGSSIELKKLYHDLSKKNSELYKISDNTQIKKDISSYFQIPANQDAKVMVVKEFEKYLDDKIKIEDDLFLKHMELATRLEKYKRKL